MKWYIDKEPILTSEWNPGKLLLLSIIVFIAVGGVGIYLFSIKSVPKKSESVTPVPTFSTAPTPIEPLNTTPPYVRLVVSEQTFGLRESVPVEVYLNSGDRRVVELDIVVTYDQETLEIAESDINFEKIFHVSGIEAIGEGKVMFSLFNETDIGHLPVMLPTETKVATLYFKTLTLEKVGVPINLIFNKGKNTGTRLIEYEPEDEKQVTNILESVHNLDIIIAS
ncbi:hypothetical protein HY408_00810 [Candidatus Gottesmanbacteria bacterium]|nr:hypothetical protein [Candidatus Gottesmanbacteria bacterium]